MLAWLACIVLLIAAASNLFGNISLSSMLVSATLDSSYVALAMYAGSKVMLALFQVALAGPTVARMSARYAGSLVPAVVNVGRALLVVGWLLFTLQSFRISRPGGRRSRRPRRHRPRARAALAKPDDDREPRWQYGQDAAFALSGPTEACSPTHGLPAKVRKNSSHRELGRRPGSGPGCVRCPWSESRAQARVQVLGQAGAGMGAGLG